jgi:anti-sigma factor RsiW
MMDETVSEILSRHLDGDLGPEEERMLTARLEAEPALAAELEAIRRIRSAVVAFAASESTPTELDTLVEPLLCGKPEPLVARPWARWLATAAVVVFGLTVIIEVNRRNPGPSVGSIARRFRPAPCPWNSSPLVPAIGCWRAPSR